MISLERHVMQQIHQNFPKWIYFIIWYHQCVLIQVIKLFKFIQMEYQTRSDSLSICFDLLNHSLTFIYTVKVILQSLIKWGAPSRWSFRSISAWGSIETTMRKTTRRNSMIWDFMVISMWFRWRTVPCRKIKYQKFGESICDGTRSIENSRQKLVFLGLLPSQMD